MKAFVIKNKEGKYLSVSSSNYEHYWTTIDFAHYFRFLNETHDAKQEAEEFRDTRYPDCKVVEITISEGDLEKENRVLKRALEIACEKLADVFGECPYSNMNLPMPEYCDEECINNEKYLCWDKYFIKQAKGEKDE